jgi:AcrR family transcriptional regulator
MQDISQAAGISVGLIYRYFESKEQVIATMASRHLTDLQRKLEEARQLPALFDALEMVLWCDEHRVDVAASYVVDLFAESARNPAVRRLVGAVQDALLKGVTDLIASAPEAAHLAEGLTPPQAAETVFQTVHGMMFDEILHLDDRTQPEIMKNRTETLHRLWALLFPALRGATSSAAVNDHVS